MLKFLRAGLAGVRYSGQFPLGMPGAHAGGVREGHRTLVAWQLATELRREVLALTSCEPASRNVRFRVHTEDAAASVCRNLREGYYRFNPGEFSNFVRYSEASLAELAEQLEEGLERNYWPQEDTQAARMLCKRTGAALGRLRRYLLSRQARENATQIRARSQAAHAKPERTNRTRRTQGTKRTQGT